MKFSIYTTTDKGMAYQRGNTRVVLFRDGTSKHEIKRDGVWTRAKGYIKPTLVKEVKEALGVK